MKTDIHPKYFDSVEIRCSCGNKIIVGSTKEKLTTELCSACHPFYTGKVKLIDTAGRVDKFEERRKKVTALRNAAKLQSEKAKRKPEAYVEKEVPEEVLKRAMGESPKKKGKWGEPLGDSFAEEVIKTQEAVAKKPLPKKKAPTKQAAVKKPASKQAAVKKPAAKKAAPKKKVAK